MRFAEDHGYELVYVMSWLDGKQPSWDNLYRLAADLSGPDRKVTPAWLLFGEDGGLQLVKSSMSTVVAKSRRSKRSRGKIIGAVALLGALAGSAIPAIGDAPITTNYVKNRRRRVALHVADQLALDLAA